MMDWWRICWWLVGAIFKTVNRSPTSRWKGSNHQRCSLQKNQGVHHFPSKGRSLRQSRQTQSRSHLKNCVTDEGNKAEGDFEAGLVDEHHADGNLDATQEKYPDKELPHGEGDLWSTVSDYICRHHASLRNYFYFLNKSLSNTTEVHRSVTATQDSSRKC